ncbi:unnamed protein product, partial [Phaeothamnion confervicola]
REKEKEEKEEEEDSDDGEFGDDPVTQRLAAAHMESLRRAMEARVRLAALGYGAATELDWREVEPAAAAADVLVCHFYDPDWEAGAQLDLLLERLAAEFRGTRFVRCRAQRDTPLAVRYRVQGGGVLLCFRGGSVAATVDATVEFTKGDALEAAAAEQWLRRAGVLVTSPPPLDVLEKRCRGTVSCCLERTVSGWGEPGGGDNSSSEDDAGNFYECGLAGCRRRFAHDHVGSAAGGG